MLFYTILGKQNQLYLSLLSEEAEVYGKVTHPPQPYGQFQIFEYFIASGLPRWLPGEESTC